jgi:hypothetical protein
MRLLIAFLVFRLYHYVTIQPIRGNLNLMVGVPIGYRTAYPIRQEQMISNKLRILAYLALLLLSLASSTVLLIGQLNPLALPQATLTSPISASDTLLNVDNAIGFPATGEVAIGTEVLAYSSITTNSFVVSGRGQASTTAAAHDAGSVVTFFPVHAGLLTTSIDAVVTTLNLNSTSTFPTGFGSMLIDQEIVNYSGGTTNTLTPLSRAQAGTTAAAHNAGALIIGRATSPLILTFTLPRLISAGDSFSGMALTNLSDGPANVSLNPFNSDGTPLTFADSTGAQVSAARAFTVAAHQQFVGNIFDMLPNLGTATDFYIQMTTGNTSALGVVPVGNVDPSAGLNRLELAPISVAPSTDVILPVALQSSQQFSADVALEVGILAGPAPSDITADFVDSNGNVVQSTTLTSLGANQRLIKGLSDLFSSLSGQTVEKGYIHLSSVAPFTAYEMVFVGKENGYLSAVSRSDAASTLNIPFAISVGPYETRLLITDGTAAVSGQAPSDTVTVRITAFNSDGSLFTGSGVTNPAVVSFPASGQLSQFISSAFGLTADKVFSGYLKVDLVPGSSSPGILASALILHTGRNQLTAVPGQIVAMPKFVLTPALFDQQITTALSLVNPNSAPAPTQIQIIRGSGSLQESQTVMIPASGQAIAVFSSLFPDIGVESDGYALITSPLPLYGMLVFDNGVFLASGYPLRLPAEFVASPNPMGLSTPLDSTVPASASSFSLSVQIPAPAPAGGFQVNLKPQNSNIASLSSNTLIIPEGQTSGTVEVTAHLSGATVVNVTAPGFRTTSVVVNVQNTSDFTLSRNLGISPNNAAVSSGGTVQFNLSFDTTNNPPVLWNVSGVLNGQNAIGTITQSGFYTAPLLLPTDQPIRLAISATNANTTFFSASTTVTILPPPQ